MNIIFGASFGWCLGAPSRQCSGISTFALVPHLAWAMKRKIIFKPQASVSCSSLRLKEKKIRSSVQFCQVKCWTLHKVAVKCVSLIYSSIRHILVHTRKSILITVSGSMLFFSHWTNLRPLKKDISTSKFSTAIPLLPGEPGIYNRPWLASH